MGLMPRHPPLAVVPATLALPGWLLLVTVEVVDVGSGLTGPPSNGALAVGALATLIVGGILVGFLRGYTERTVEQAQEEPVYTSLWGLIFAVAMGIVLLVLTVVGGVIQPEFGVFVAISLAVIIWVAFVFWGTIGYLAVGSLLTTNWWAALAVAVVLRVLIELIPIVGVVVSLGIALLGVGAGFLDITGHDHSAADRAREASDGDQLGDSRGYMLVDPPEIHSEVDYQGHGIDADQSKGNGEDD